MTVLCRCWIEKPVLDKANCVSKRLGTSTSSLKDSRPAVGGNHRPHQGALPAIRYAALARLQFVLGRGMNQVTLADRWPIQAVRFVQDDFMRRCFARRALSGTHDDLDGVFSDSTSGFETITQG